MYLEVCSKCLIGLLALPLPNLWSKAESSSKRLLIAAL